jgi:predicted thioesterase
MMHTFDTIKPGLIQERMVTIDESLVITHTKVPVLSTPKMIDLMEGVCKDLAQSLLPPEFITSGMKCTSGIKRPLPSAHRSRHGAKC